MRNLALPRIQEMKPYSPPLAGRSQYDGTLLDFNERTRSSKSTLQAIVQLAADEKLQLYPEYFDLEANIARYAGVEPPQVMITNGTDQGIDVIFRTFADKDDAVIIPVPTFAMYSQYAQVAGNRVVSPLYRKADLSFPLEEVMASIDESIKLVVVCNPNNPTGTLVSLDGIEQIAKRAKNAIVYVDEAYFEFSGCTAVNLIEKFPNIVVTRTFSKAFGLASFRIAYVIAHPEYITQMLKVRGPYDVNKAAYYAAEAAIGDEKAMRRYAEEVMNEAKPFTEQFFDQNGVRFYPSAGNFILFRPESSDEVQGILRRNGILVRPQDKPTIEGTLRLTIGTLEQMKHFTEIYETAVLGKAGGKYVFLDRDGTLIFEPQDTYQVDSVEKLQILDGVVEGLTALTEQGYKLIMVTNQDGLGTSAFPAEDFEAPQLAMLRLFADAGVTFERIFICPHVAQEGCICRKPKAGLLEEFMLENAVDMDRSFVCGDRQTDEDLAGNLGLTFAPMITNGDFSRAIELFTPQRLEGRL